MVEQDYIEIANHISNTVYRDNISAAKELVNLFNNILRVKPDSWESVVKVYDDTFYTYQTWAELILSENEQSDGLSEEQCKSELGSSIWQLPCGWYVQAV